MQRAVLVAVAAEPEVRAVLDALDNAPMPPEWGLVRAGPFEVLRTGVGKANAAGAVARSLDPDAHRLVLSVGLGGALPGSDLGVGDVVVASASVFADEGIATPGGFSDAAAMGFPPAAGGCSLPAVTDLAADLPGVGDAAVGVVATVSTCSGTDRAAHETVRRTGAVVEAMEGAAVGLAALRAGVPHGEVRIVSNTTGDRTHQVWDVPAALSRLGAGFGRR